METLQKIQSKLDEADIVVVGIGEEFTFSAEDYRNTRVGKRYIEDTGEETIPEVIKALAIRELNCEPYIKAYNNLAKLLDGKTYFINTLNTDDIIFQSVLKKERITAPCGSLNRMQCNEGCDNTIFRESICLTRYIAIGMRPVCLGRIRNRNVKTADRKLSQIPFVRPVI